MPTRVQEIDGSSHPGMQGGESGAWAAGAGCRRSQGGASPPGVASRLAAPGRAPCDQETVPAPLQRRQDGAALAQPAATWIEAWMPQSAYLHLHPGQSALIGLTGAGLQAYAKIEGAVTDVVPGNSPGVLGSPRFCRLRIRPLATFFVSGRTYHPLLPGLAIQVALRAAGGTLLALLAAVRTQPV